MNNETLFTINLEDKATSKINTIGNELSKLQTDFNKMCNLQPFVMVGNLFAQISDKLSFIGQNSLFAVNSASSSSQRRLSRNCERTVVSGRMFG